MFDLSLGQLGFIALSMYLVLGRDDMMKGARIAGRLLGKSVVRVNAFRARAMDAVNSKSLEGVRPELREGFQSLMELQNEIRSASMNPVHSVQHAVMNEMANKRREQGHQAGAGANASGQGDDQAPRITQNSHPGSAALRKRLQSAAVNSVTPLVGARLGATASTPASTRQPGVRSGQPANRQSELISLEPIRLASPLNKAQAAMSEAQGGMKVTTEGMQGGADILLRGIEYRKAVEAYEQVERGQRK